MSVTDEKAKLRSRMLAHRATRSPDEKRKIDSAIFEQVLLQERLKNCKVLFIYMSVADEICTHTLIELALSLGKTVCLPKCGAGGTMSAHQIFSPSELTNGRLGIPEPDSTCPMVLPEQIDFIIAPCLCVDHKGYRIGYGGGYYDRFLAHAVHASVFALCASDCVVTSAYPEAHDIPVHKIITEREVLNINEE